MKKSVNRGNPQKGSNIIALLMCVVGVVLNITLSYVMSVLELPLYLDTLGTVIIAILGGYLPGVAVGFTTNIIKSIMTPVSVYYGIVNVLIAVVAAFFAHRGWHKKVRGVIGMLLCFGFIGGALGSLIPWFIEGATNNSQFLSDYINQTGLVGEGASLFISSLIVDLADKVVVVVLALIIVHFIPDKYHGFFGLHTWMQNPNSVDEKVTTKKVRRVSLRFKVLMVLILSLGTIAITCSLISMDVFRRRTIEDHTQLAMGTTILASSVIDGDRVGEYMTTGGNTKSYKETKRLLEKIYDSSSEITFLYVYQIKEDGCHVVFDIDSPDTKGEDIGTVIEFDEGFKDYIPDLLAGNDIDPIITEDQYGYLLTCYRAVHDSSGRCVCYVGADVDMKDLNADSRSFLTEMITIFMGFFVLLCVFTVWLTYHHIISPIDAIARCMEKLSHSSATQRETDEGVREFRQLDIHTGDEIENLYKTASTMTKNQAEQMRSIRRLSDYTAKMQDGLIITMADMVESRDSDTGAHVQKTAAYVKIIVEGLEKKGYYPHKITPKFKSDVVRSAPLHDIGKIHIPDNVLNKPGKLTKEEFEIMKTHTTAGRRILENAISTTEGDNYLKEARNMAAYHHERWDGKGYPEGIHGEVIPLSARIMSVADVFDALTSPRVYKPAFPLEEAISIMEEGKGTQFDPKCVEVFFEALPEVKVILRKYNQQ